MFKRLRATSFLALAALTVAALLSAHASPVFADKSSQQAPQAVSSKPIYGIFFYQTKDDMHIVYLNHAATDTTDENFGTNYNADAVNGCLRYVSAVTLVRYRMEINGSYTAICYTDPSFTHYVAVPGTTFGMDVINNAVARAQQIVYPS